MALHIALEVLGMCNIRGLMHGPKKGLTPVNPALDVLIQQLKNTKTLLTVMPPWSMKATVSISESAPLSECDVWTQWYGGHVASPEKLETWQKLDLASIYQLVAMSTIVCEPSDCAEDI